jgi:hypothetical protein
VEKNGVMNVMGRDLHTLFGVGVMGTVSDGQLLDRFMEWREEAVFEAIVRRHGPMVWGVCRRVLRDHHDTEDAFQGQTTETGQENELERLIGEKKAELQRLIDKQKERGQRTEGQDQGTTDTQYLRDLGHERCRVVFGWHWGMAYPPGAPWDAMDIALSDLGHHG